MFGLSFWVLPLFAACTWLGTLLAMLGVWISEGSPHYPSMDDTQQVAYISDIGAEGLKPLFIAGSAVTVVVFDLAFISERWLRHKGRLAPNTSTVEKVCSICSVIASIIGAAGLIFLTIFDTLHHHHAHDALLVVFIVGYIVSAIFVCAEYQRLGVHFRQYRILRASFWIKLAFIFIEVALAIAFGVEDLKGNYNKAAYLEWIVALFYILYVASYVLDFIPAVHSRNHRYPSVDGLESGENVVKAETPSYSSEQAMAETADGRYYQPPTGPVAPSRNF